MGRPRGTFLKRERETKLKQRALAKEARRATRRAERDAPTSTDASVDTPGGTIDVPIVPPPPITGTK